MLAVVVGWDVPVVGSLVFNEVETVGVAVVVCVVGDVLESSSVQGLSVVDSSVVVVDEGGTKMVVLVVVDTGVGVADADVVLGLMVVVLVGVVGWIVPVVGSLVFKKVETVGVVVGVCIVGEVQESSIGVVLSFVDSSVEVVDVGGT